MYPRRTAANEPLDTSRGNLWRHQIRPLVQTDGAKRSEESQIGDMSGFYRLQSTQIL